MSDDGPAILFLENSPEKVQQVRDYCPTVDTILVKETPHARSVKLLNIPGLSLKKTLQMKYKSAITPSIIARIKEWVKLHKDVQKHVLFDWGRTITQLEGIRIRIVDPKHYEKILEFVCNGPRRVTMLRTMFAYLHSAGCKIYLLTNSKSCKYSSYREIAQQLAGTDIPLQFICSGLSTANGHKGVAMKKHNTFRNMCKGSKRQQTRKRSNK
jgi:hypothetical protein